MKRLLALLLVSAGMVNVQAQQYPDPEFANEIYLLKKDTPYKLIRLEKESSKMNTSQGMMSGAESGYTIAGATSPVRLQRGSKFSFIYSSASAGSSTSTATSFNSDSMMRANGVDPSMVGEMTSMHTDPVQNLTLYKLDIGKGERKIILQKSPGANPFGKHKITSSEKYTFSTRKIKNGYLEFIVDKPLPKGEYAFTMNQPGMNMMGDVLIFAFGID